MKNPSPWLTPEQTVEFLGLPSRKALYQAVRRGQIPVHHLGRRLRFLMPELDELLSGDRLLTDPAESVPSIVRRPLAEERG